MGTDHDSIEWLRAFVALQQAVARAVPSIPDRTIACDLATAMVNLYALESPTGKAELREGDTAGWFAAIMRDHPGVAEHLVDVLPADVRALVVESMTEVGGNDG